MKLPEDIRLKIEKSADKEDICCCWPVSRAMAWRSRMTYTPR
jgi:hypothetical protein